MRAGAGGLLMKRLAMVAVSALLFTGFCAPADAASGSLKGDWVGGCTLFDQPVFVHVRFTENASGLGGITNIQAWKVTQRPLSLVKADDAEVHFEFPSEIGIPFLATGQLKDGVITGTMRRGEDQGNFHLIHAATVDPKLFDAYVGVYAFTDPKDAGVPKPQLITYG